MSKAVLISIKPEWCRMIEAGEKVIEIRKGRPKLETPFKCYIYQTHSGKVGTGLFLADGSEIQGRSVKNGTVIGEFTCKQISDIMISCSDPDMKGIPFPGTGLTDKEIMDYLGNGKTGYGWHISDLQIYDTPKKFSEFLKPCPHGEDSSCFVCEKSGYAPDMHIDCFNTITRPPQSWCYVEELSGGGSDG